MTGRVRRLIEPLYERYLELQCTAIPRHIAIIQDGNRRRSGDGRDHGQGSDEGKRAHR